MNTAIKFIMHGLASGRVRSTPAVLDVLKELKRGPQGSPPGSDNSARPPTRESESVARQTPEKTCVDSQSF